MKKIFAFIICLLLVLAMPLAVFAEDGISDAVGEDEVIEDTLPSEDETVTEGENEGEEVTPEPTPESTPTPTPEPEPEPEPTPTPTPEPPDTDAVIDLDAEVQTVTEKIEAWFERNSGALGIIVTIIGYGIALLKIIGRSNQTITTANNNSVTISENYGKLMTDALKELKVVSALVTEIRRTKEERDLAEKSLAEVSSYLKATRMANKELADEVAELLVLANIPNSKKDELYARHRAAVAAIEEAEKAAEKTEVMENVEKA